MIRRTTALLVSKDPETRRVAEDLTRTKEFVLRTASSLGDALRRLAADRYHAVLLDLDLSGVHASDLLESIPDETKVVFITGDATVETAVTALRGGVADYLTKPVDEGRLAAILDDVQRAAALPPGSDARPRDARTPNRFDEMLGESPAMQAVYDLIERVAPTPATVLVTGETGTGKELVARAVHRFSPRRDKPFVAVNCGAVAPSLMESELFGHERGSFTGADNRHRGVFEQADGGTLFFDEVTEMRPELQVKLLRVLESMRVTRVGGTRAVPVDVRIIAATNRVPDAAVAEGKLREDLLYRLSVFPITLPPLRERPGDVRLLAEAFVERMNLRSQQHKVLGPSTVEVLEGYSWPGNVRELVNVIERAHIMADRVIGIDTLVRMTEELGETETEPVPGSTEGLTIAEVERRHILNTLDRQHGNKKETAHTLGISLKTLYNRLKEYRTE